MYTRIHNIPAYEDFRRKLRKNPTKAEYLLWQQLRRKQFHGKRFKRQHSLGRYIMDFYCPEHKLCIELDGAHHYTPEGKKYDAERTAFLNSYGIRVVRFPNRLAEREMGTLLAKLRGELEVTTPPRPSPYGRGTQHRKILINLRTLCYVFCL